MDQVPGKSIYMYVCNIANVSRRLIGRYVNKY